MTVEIKNLNGAVIFTADGTNLIGANLRDANLIGANLRDANLQDANLIGANLRGADLAGANLRRAKLRGADLCGANLSNADLRCADLRSSDLGGVNLRHADLLATELDGADLSYTEVFAVSKSLATHNYDVFATSTHVRIGCQFHTWGDWMEFCDAAILKMGGSTALKFWRVWKPILRSIAASRGWDAVSIL